VITEVPRGPAQRRQRLAARRAAVRIRLRPELRIVEGRRFRPGLRELIVGRGAQRQFDGLEVGRTLDFRGSTWTLVGVFDTGGDSHESELWADAEAVQSSFNRSGFSSVLVQLRQADAFDALQARLTADPQLTVDVERERDYFSAQSETLGFLIGLLTRIIAAIMAFGALFGALNTMYSAVASRTAEIGTLRALGFGAAPVIASVMAEALALAASRRPARRRHRLRAVQRLQRQHAGLGLHPGRVQFRGDAGAGRAGLRLGAGHRLPRRPAAGAAGRAPAGDRGAARLTLLRTRGGRRSRRRAARGDAAYIAASARASRGSSASSGARCAAPIE
jgi:hypothetical protein